jgi:hypothetical protein
MSAFLSGEFFLKNRPNGGTVVLRRTVFISVLLYLLAIGFKSRLAPGATWHPDWTVARELISETLPWFGAIFAGVYVALYSRFASQWNYLASLYNQIMSTLVEHPPVGSTSEDMLALWQAGFIEDAEELHLARKPMFASVIASMLDEKAVRDAYIAYAPGGEPRLRQLEAAVERVLSHSRDKHSAPAKPEPLPASVPLAQIQPDATPSG